MIGQRLHRARKAAGFSLRDLGEKIGLTHAAIKKYEDGLCTPSSSTLLKLARTLNVRTEYFFRPETLTLDGIEYRKRSTLPKKTLDVIQHEVIDQIERRVELESLFPKPPVETFAGIDGLPETIKCLSEIEVVANSVRSEWRLGLDPIPDLIDLLETRGIRVFMIDIKSKFDGLAATVNQMPIVVVDKNWTGDRQRFTLAHELGHLILSSRLSHELDEEKACNRFAGAFLIPQESVFDALGKKRSSIEPKELALLKEEFGLSMSGILYRALDLEIVTPAWRTNQAKLFNIKKWNIKEPGNQYPSEKAHTFEKLVFHALAEDYIGESKAAELMKLSVSSFQTLRSLEAGNASFN